MKLRGVMLLVGTATIFYGCARAHQSRPSFQDHFSASSGSWRSYLSPGKWSVVDGVLRKLDAPDRARLAQIEPAADVLIETEVRVSATGRRCFGVVMRGREDGTCLVLRYYDGTNALQLLSYDAGAARLSASGPAGMTVEPGKWYRMKAVVIGDQFLGKIWPSTENEPSWQMRSKVKLTSAAGWG